VSQISIKRVYDPASRADGRRILVDRLWPRGLTKAEAKLDAWMKDVAPSTELRRWFDHKPERWQEFRKRYREELRANPAFGTLRDMAEAEPVTLLYAARDQTQNEAVVLAEQLGRHR
jgi:uncharacterized protein YeaO (DUF488 family)